MAVCDQTGVTVPECSCRACLQSLLDQHAPGTPPQPEATEATEIEVGRHRRLPLASRLRDLRHRRAA
jgi:hypothetical protein